MANIQEWAGLMVHRVVSAAERFGIHRPLPPDFDQATQATIQAVRTTTMTSPERIAAVCDAARYVAKQRIPGSIVECGVWRGGSSIAMMRTLVEASDTGRDVYLYDTFEGMSEPTEFDRAIDGESAASLLARTSRSKDNSVWCIASLEDVSRNVASAGYPRERIHLVQGKVEDTIPATIPDEIAILRLDTDWYESTEHELAHLFPRLTTGGVLIIDDYGHWEGVRRAVDEYFDQNGIRVLLNRIDYTGRIAIKQ